MTTRPANVDFTCSVYCRSTGDQHAYQSSRDIRNGFDAIIEAVEPPPRVEPPPGQQRAAPRRRRILLTAFSRNRQSRQSAFIFPSRYAPASNARTCRSGLSTPRRTNVRLLLKCSTCRMYAHAHHALAIGLTAHRPTRHPTCTLDTGIYGKACGPHLYLPTYLCAPFQTHLLLTALPITTPTPPWTSLGPTTWARPSTRLSLAWCAVGGWHDTRTCLEQPNGHIPANGLTRFRCTGTAVMPAAV